MFPQVTDADFDTKILKDPRGDLMVVEVWGRSCKICPGLEAKMEEHASTPGVHFFRACADVCPDIVDNFGIQGVPVLLLFRDGALVAQSRGSKTLTDLPKFLHKYA